MSTQRQKRRPVFDPHALENDLDELWPTPQPTPATKAPEPQRTPQATAPGPTPTITVAQTQTPPADTATPAPTPQPSPPSPPPTSTATAARTRHLATVAAAPAADKKRIRPPEVLLSSEVYDELYRVQIAEKRTRRGLARTMGAIVLDAIEAHAAELTTTWTNQQCTVGEGQLFERPSSNAVPRRRRHATAPRTVVLSGVTPANSNTLDNLVQAWNAGTRSALVEQALRYEFGLLLQH